MEVGQVCWMHNRVFIVGKIGSKWITGLVINADGLSTLKSGPQDLTPAMYKGKPYPPAKMRGHLRKARALTKTAKKIRKELLA